MKAVFAAILVVALLAGGGLKTVNTTMLPIFSSATSYSELVGSGMAGIKILTDTNDTRTIPESFAANTAVTNLPTVKCGDDSMEQHDEIVIKLTETRNQRNATVQIEMNFGKPAKLKLTNATIGQLSSGVFQIVVGDEHGACQLAKKIINPDLSPCTREDKDERDREIKTESAITRKYTTKQRKQHKTTESKLSLAKMHTIVRAEEPPDVLLHQARRKIAKQSDTIVSRNNTAKQRNTQEYKLPMLKMHPSIISAEQSLDVQLQVGQDPTPKYYHTVTSDANNQAKVYLLKRPLPMFPFSSLGGVVIAFVPTDGSNRLVPVPPSTMVMVRRRLSTVLNWAELRGACTSDGTIELGDGFVMGTYTGECDFTGKNLVVDCRGKTLDAGKGGRFFHSNGGWPTASSSSLTLRGCTLKDGLQSGSVSLFFCRAA
jgi:hypothetical protein